MTRSIVRRHWGELEVGMLLLLLLLLLGVVVRPNVLRPHRSLNERVVGEGWLLGCFVKKGSLSALLYTQSPTPQKEVESITITCSLMIPVQKAELQTRVASSGQLNAGCVGKVPSMLLKVANNTISGNSGIGCARCVRCQICSET
jgi:hypothetical protein